MQDSWVIDQARRVLATGLNQMQIHEDFQQHGNWFPRENITKSKMVGIILFAFGVGYLVMVLHQTGEDNGGTLPFSVGCGSAQKTLVCQALRGYGVGP